MENIEKVYVIQPRLDENCRVLHEEAVALIESAGAEYCGTTYQTIKKNQSCHLFRFGQTCTHTRTFKRP